MPIYENSEIYEFFEGQLKDLLSPEEPLTFLVGAGISMDPPSSLASSREMSEAIIRYTVPPESVEELLSLKNLRYEFVIERFRDTYDENFKVLEYFTEADQPNSIHKFLARMVQLGQFVITTNFDFLIETAIGLSDPALRVIITQEDFSKYGDPDKNWQNDILAVYKIHGSLKNPKTGEDTRNSIISTLDAHIKNKQGEIFSLEVYKRSFFEKVARDRTLIVMGYSAGDDFDIIPALITMKGLKRVIWISHDRTRFEPRIYRLRSDLNSETIISSLNKEDRLLLKMSAGSDLDIIKVRGNTWKSLSDAFAIPVSPGATQPKKNPYKWLVKNAKEIDPESKMFFVGLMFSALGEHERGNAYFEHFLTTLDKSGNKERKIPTLVNMAKNFAVQKKYTEALKSYLNALEICEELGLVKETLLIYGNVGMVYNQMGRRAKAVEIYKKCFELNRKWNDQEGMMMDLFRMASASTGYKSLFLYSSLKDQVEKYGSLELMSEYYANLGEAYVQAGKYKDAIEASQKSYEIDENLGRKSGMVKNLMRIGDSYSQVGRINDALEVLNKSFRVNKEIKDVLNAIIILRMINTIYLKKKREDKAKSYLNLALENLNKLESPLDLANQCLLLGSSFKDLKDFSTAIQCCSKALEIYARYELHLQVILSLKMLGQVHADMGEGENAIEFYKRAELIKTTLKEGSPETAAAKEEDKISAMNKITRTLEKSYKTRYESIKDEGETIAVSKILGMLGVISNSSHEFSKAIDYLLKAYAINQRLDNLEGMAQNTSYLGRCYYQTAKYRKAVDYLNKAKTIYGQLNNTTKLYEVLVLLTSSYRKVQDEQKVVATLQELLEIAIQLGDPEKMGNCYNDLGNYSFNMARFDEARECYLKAYKRYQERGNLKLIANALMGIGTTYYHEENFSKAISHCQKALDLIRAIDEPELLYTWMARFGDYLREAGQLDEALKITEKVISYYQQQKKPALLANTLNNKAYILADQKQFKDAYHTLDQASKINPTDLNILHSKAEILRFEEKYSQSNQLLEMLLMKNLTPSLKFDCLRVLILNGVAQKDRDFVASKYSELDTLVREAQDVKLDFRFTKFVQKVPEAWRISDT
jgi:tetratricopeptide (TPR) repeat protein/NAD-dependent SIR2 family protein deacetylase